MSKLKRMNAFEEQLWLVIFAKHYDPEARNFDTADMAASECILAMWGYPPVERNLCVADKSLEMHVDWAAEEPPGNE